MTLILVSGLFIAAALAIAKPLTRWIAERPDNFDPDILPLSNRPRTLEEKRALLQAQVTAKLHWEADEDEVFDWLVGKQGLAEVEAEAMLAIAKNQRKRAIRSSAAGASIACALGLAIVAILIAVQFITEEVYLWSLPLLFVAMILCSMGLARYAMKLVKAE